jgi:integrase
MASVSRDANGTKRVLFTDGDGERRSVRLGKVSVKAAESFRLRVEALLAAKELHQSPDAELAAWLHDLPERMHARLVRVGLTDPRASATRVTLGGLLAAFFAGVDVKPATRVRMEQVKTAMVDYFTDARDVATIDEADAESWRAKLKEHGYAPATISRTVLYARQVFRWAIRRGMASRNPFAALKAGSQTNTARAVFVSRDTIAKVIDAAPDAEWRLLIVLSRFGGLRVPSEALALRWSDVDWEHNRLTVRSPKTEHHEGKGERIIPLFPEIREHLQTVFDAAPVGSVNVIGRYREGANLNPHFRRIIERAGLTPWDRTWHNLRASRQTELAATYPLHTVCAWIGNTKAIAAGHYLQVTDADWTRATGGTTGCGESGAKSGALSTQKAAQHPTAHDRGPSRESSETPCFAGVSQPDADERETMRNKPMGSPGLEPGTPAFSMRCSTN